MIAGPPGNKKNKNHNNLLAGPKGSKKGKTGGGRAHLEFSRYFKKRDLLKAAVGNMKKRNNNEYYKIMSRLM